MMKAYIAAVLVVTCILCELSTCSAGTDCPSSPGGKRNRTRCKDHSECPGPKRACLGNVCQPCKCRLKEQCFLNKANKANCNCSGDPLHFGDYCECPLSLQPKPASLPIVQTLPSPCDHGWIFCDGSCYLFGADLISWYASDTFCQHSGGQLAKVDSAAEHTCIVNKLNAINDGVIYWISGRYFRGEYVWGDMTPVTSPDVWAPNSPGTTQGCMGYHLEPSSLWRWNAWAFPNCFSANFANHYICEKDAP